MADDSASTDVDSDSRSTGRVRIGVTRIVVGAAIRYSLVALLFCFVLYLQYLYCVYVENKGTAIHVDNLGQKSD